MMLRPDEIPSLENPIVDPERLQFLAKDALYRAEVAPWCNPLRIALGLNRTLRAVTRSEERAALEGCRIRYLWVPDPKETGLNVFVGDALAVLDDAGIQHPSLADIALTAGFLALPDPTISPEVELTLQEHAPAWFLREHQRRRRWNRASTSGIFTAVGNR